jgi:hypothetical protein
MLFRCKPLQIANLQSHRQFWYNQWPIIFLLHHWIWSGLFGSKFGAINTWKRGHVGGESANARLDLPKKRGTQESRVESQPIPFPVLPCWEHGNFRRYYCDGIVCCKIKLARNSCEITAFQSCPSFPIRSWVNARDKRSARSPTNLGAEDPVIHMLHSLIGWLLQQRILSRSHAFPTPFITLALLPLLLVVHAAFLVSCVSFWTLTAVSWNWMRLRNPCPDRSGQCCQCWCL